MAMKPVQDPRVMRNKKLCSLHFDATCYAHPQSVRLNRNAVPTLQPMRPPTEPKAPISLEGSFVSQPLASHPPSADPNIPITPPSVSTFSHTSPPSPKPSTSVINPVLPETPKSSIRPSSRATYCVKSRKSLFKDMDIRTFGSLSPRKRKLFRIIKTQRDKLRKIKKECKQRGYALKNISNIDKSPVVKNLFEGMPSATASFLISQLRWHKRALKARRWDLDDKILALAIMKRSPKCYALLRRFFALPSRSTLTRLLHKVPFYPGINEQLFVHLSEILCNRSPLDRICILMFDEMLIREHIQYDRRTDTIVGLENHGARYKSDQFANPALVFQVVGVQNNWKQPLAYYFNRGPVSSLRLKPLLLEVLDACTHANMEVIALVCDMGTNNVKTLKEMGSSVADPYIKHNGRSIATMFDPPHLLKCLAQLFRKYPIRIPAVVNANDKANEMTAQWKHFEQARAVDNMSRIDPLRTMIKITDAHMKPTMHEGQNCSPDTQPDSSQVYVHCCYIRCTG